MRVLKYAFWGLASLLFFALLTMPLSSNAQIIMSAGCIAIVGIMKFLRAKGLTRVIAIALTSAVIIRYVFWRTTQTLPSMMDPASAIPGYVLYGAEMYSVLMLILSLFVMMRTQEDRPAPIVTAENAPSVDVFIPSYNEPAEMLAKTIMAAQRMMYPGKKTIWLLDDGGTDQRCESDNEERATESKARRALLTRMCAELGVNYLTRARNEHAKAGNLNNAFFQSEGDLILVFDADHAPSPDFLMNTAGFFLENERLAIVQTPHFFINPDPIERNLGLVGKVPSESEMFYAKIQRGLNYREGAFFCGSGALIRRAALMEVDGFAGRSITEDCESTVGLHAKGWHTHYVGKVMLAGLQPETFSSFIGQRSRWAQGMIQILLLNRPFMKRGLKFSQRMCYLSSILFWFFPISRLVFLLAPICYLIFDLKIFTASGGDFLAYTISYVAANLVLQNLLYGDVRRPWMSEVYEFAQSVHLGRALLSILMNPTSATFKVTSKDEVADEHRISDIGMVYYWVFGFLVLMQGWAVYRMITEPYNLNLLMAVSVWNILNILLAGTALGAVNERPGEKPTIDVRRVGSVVFKGEVTENVRIVSADDDGVVLTLPHELKTQSVGTRMQITIPDSHRPGAEPIGCGITLTGVSKDGHVRADFVPGLDALAVGCSLLFDNPEKWRKYDMNRPQTGVIMGTINFLILALKQTIRGLSGLVSKPQKKIVAKA